MTAGKSLLIRVPALHILSLFDVAYSLAAGRNARFSHIYRAGSRSDPNFALADILSPLEYCRKVGSLDVDSLSRSFPSVATLETRRHVAPKLAFLHDTLLRDVNESTKLEACLARLPPHYLGSRLESEVAPRHALLVALGLPSGHALLERSHSGGECLPWGFLRARSDAQFATWCAEVARDHEPSRLPSPSEVSRFCAAFRKGVLAAAMASQADAQEATSRDPIVFGPSGAVIAGVKLGGGTLVELLLSHGADYSSSRPEANDRIAPDPLHWTCGAGNLAAAKALARAHRAACHAAASADQVSLAPLSMAELRDGRGATVLHWAAAGIEGGPTRPFGSGGHAAVVEWLVEEQGCDPNAETQDGNTVLMWAAWGGDLKVVEMLVRFGADPHCANDNGCSAAHWAAGAKGDEAVAVCAYLKVMSRSPDLEVYSSKELAKPPSMRELVVF
mmetsp:Transcript_35423/g.79925  ORF Transcript_35423/g.79925 Transcript_35423/m.79925 type:complete len:447 (-) Transcript_35423:923-2263(-)